MADEIFAARGSQTRENSPGLSDHVSQPESQPESVVVVDCRSINFFEIVKARHDEQREPAKSDDGLYQVRARFGQVGGQLPV